MHEQIDTNSHPVLKFIFVMFLIAVIAAAAYFVFLFGTHEHNSDVWVEATPATCISQGERHRVCDECGESYSREILPVTDHDYDWTLVAEGDSSLKMVGACSSCTEKREIPVSWSDVVVSTTDPTCASKGKVTYTAVGYNGSERVSATLSTTIPALTHTPGTPVVEKIVNVSCDTDASYDTVTYCSDCGAELERNTTVTESAYGHTSSDPVVENYKAATCTKNGYYEYVTYCSVCDDELAREGKALLTVPHPYRWQLIRESEENFTMLGNCECGKIARVALDYDLDVTVTYNYGCVSAGTVNYTASIIYEGAAATATYSATLPYTGYHVHNGVDIATYQVEINGTPCYLYSDFIGQVKLVYDKEAGETESDAWNDNGYTVAYLKCENCGTWLRITLYNDLVD